MVERQAAGAHTGPGSGSAPDRARRPEEVAFATLGRSTVAWSEQLGRATYELVHLLIERLLAARCSLPVETPFDPDRANPRFQALQARHAFREVQVLLSTPAGLLRRRYAGRTDSGERHPGRVDR